ncbi:MAG: universal stress protein [Kofleriaceae bacterium]|nr:universal stress protein [Kofleriaceae bacterium]
MGTTSTSALDTAPARRHRILLCLDGTASSETCIPYGVALAQIYGSHIVLVHVMQPYAPRYVGAYASDPLSWEISRQQIHHYLENLRSTIAQASGASVELRIEQGSAAARIVALARELDADVTVIGPPAANHGRTFDQVLASLGRSVLVARSAAQPDAAHMLRQILVPLDGSSRAESIIPAVARMASCNNSEVVLTHVVQAPQVTAPLYDVLDMALAQRLATRVESAAQTYLDAIAQRLRNDGVNARTVVVRHDDPRQHLLELSQAMRADLLVLSAHGATCNSAQPLGSMPAYLLKHAPAAILVLQDLPAAVPAPVEQPQPTSLQRAQPALVLV